MKTPIAKYTTNLYASEVYRELERHAVRKGHFDPTPEEQVKLAAQEVKQHEQINQPVSAEPSHDLVQDVARLAFAMRRKGFVSQAADLEEKLVIFKQAESSLYNVTSETNKDFFDMAHSDGDYQVEGFGELGAVETVENLAAKIRAVTEKNPTGKLPGKSAGLSALADLIKNADIGDEVGGGGSYSAGVTQDLAKEYKTINDQFAAYPAVGGVKAQLTPESVFDSPDLYIKAIQKAGFAGAENLTPSTITTVGELNKKLGDLGIKNHAQTHEPFAAFLESNKNNPEQLRALTTLLGTGGSWIHGYQKVLLNGEDLTSTAGNFTWTGSQQGAPVLNGGSGLILNLTGTGGGGGNPYVNSTGKSVVWDPAIKDQAARTLRQAYYNRSDSVFGQNFAALTKANEEIAKEIQALDGIRKIRVDVPQGAVDENGAVNSSVVMTPVRDAQKKYDSITSENTVGYNAIKSTNADIASAMGDWQNKFYEVVGNVEGAVASMSGQERVDVGPSMNKLQAARRAWEGVREILRPLRGPEVPKKVQDVGTNLRTINTMLSSLNAIGTPRIMNKPKQLVDAWLQTNQFSQLPEVATWADGAIQMAEQEKAKAQALASAPERTA